MSRTKRTPAPPPPAGPLILLTKVSEQRNIPLRQLRRAIKDGHLRAFKPGGQPNSRWMVAPADLDTYLLSVASKAGAA
jgi:hypothetical protein